MYLKTVFNNKGGIGKTFQVIKEANKLSENNRVLMIDLSSQSNLSQKYIQNYDEIIIEEDKEYNREKRIKDNNYHTLSYILKDTIEGETQLYNFKIYQTKENLFLLPNSLEFSIFEMYLSERYNGVFSSDTLSSKTFNAVFNIIKHFVNEYNIDYVLIDTDGTISIVNKIMLMQSDEVIVPIKKDDYLNKCYTNNALIFFERIKEEKNSLKILNKKLELNNNELKIIKIDV